MLRLPLSKAWCLFCLPFNPKPVSNFALISNRFACFSFFLADLEKPAMVTRIDLVGSRIIVYDIIRKMTVKDQEVQK